MNELPSTVGLFAARLAELGWVRDLFVAGSLALGDYVPAVSDIDLVAIVEAPLDRKREAALIALHREIDRESARACLGCIYVDEACLTEQHRRHFTWTHGTPVHRALSGISRAEVVGHGFAVFGRDPATLLPAMSNEEVRAAARAELSGYWEQASRRPWMWLNREVADLALVSMARARHSIRTGEQLAKTAAVDQVRAPEWVVEGLRARRRGLQTASPRWATAWASWRDTRRTCREASTNT